MKDSDVTEAMRPLPTDRPIPEGTPVWGSDFNAAVSQLYRWWSLLDVPEGTETRRLADGVLDRAFAVRTPELSASSPHELERALLEVRAVPNRSHHLGYDDYRLHWIDGTDFRLDARFDMQAGETNERRSITAILRRQQSGLLAILALDEAAEGSLPRRDFASSYVENRARATSTRFQAHMDSLTGDASGMRDLMMPVLELHGLVASKADRSSAGDEPLTDVDDLRKTVAGSDSVADNAIRDFDGFAAWFATAPALFAYGLHKLERFAVTPLANRRYETVAQYDWRAETVNGAEIETHHPLTWVLADTDEAYMRIEKLKPF